MGPTAKGLIRAQLLSGGTSVAALVGPRGAVHGASVQFLGPHPALTAGQTLRPPYFPPPGPHTPAGTRPILTKQAITSLLPLIHPYSSLTVISSRFVCGGETVSLAGGVPARKKPSKVSPFQHRLQRRPRLSPGERAEEVPAEVGNCVKPSLYRKSAVLRPSSQAHRCEVQGLRWPDPPRQPTSVCFGIPLASF